MVKGTFSDGLRMTQLPITKAMGSVHMGTMNGKLNGTMQATIPRGERLSSQETWDDTWRIFPWASWGSEAAYSTVSFPFATSASASFTFFPFSCTMSAASSLEFCLTSEWNLSMIAARALMVMEDQDGRAA